MVIKRPCRFDSDPRYIKKQAPMAKFGSRTTLRMLRRKACRFESDLGYKTKYMTVKQALKEKNKLVKEILTLQLIAKDYNSIDEGNVRRYSVAEVLDKSEKLIIELVELKAKIHRANASVYEKIFLMAELKMRVKFLKSMPCDEGKVTERYSTTSSIKTVEIDIIQRNEMIKLLEEKIEKLQDELDAHNALTKIE